MSDIQIFEFGGARVRTAGNWEAPLFCAADVCAVLGIVNASQACSQLDQDDLASVQHTIGRKPASFVTESGLYSLIFQSRKPEAKTFKKWVTSEVLPELRKRGYYNALEVQQRKQTELLLAEIFPNLPSKAEPIFRELIAALIRVRRETDAPGNPPWARMLAGWVYGWAIPVDGQQQHRRALNVNPSGSRLDHAMLSDEMREQVKRVVDIGVAFTRISPNWEAWRSNMELSFGKNALQLPLMVPMLVSRESVDELDLTGFRNVGARQGGDS